MTSFNLNNLIKGPVFKYSHIGGYGFNIWICGGHSSVHKIYVKCLHNAYQMLHKCQFLSPPSFFFPLPSFPSPLPTGVTFQALFWDGEQSGKQDRQSSSLHFLWKYLTSHSWWSKIIKLKIGLKVSKMQCLQSELIHPGLQSSRAQNVIKTFFFKIVPNLKTWFHFKMLISRFSWNNYLSQWP